MRRVARPGSAAEESTEEPALAALGGGVALAPVVVGHVAEHLLDVLAAAGVGRTLTGGARGSTAHTP